MSELKGLTALITGASRGIGRAVAIALARAGADVCLVATNAAALREAQLESAQTGVRTESLVLDVGDRDACFAAVAGLTDRWGKVDILVNGAGIYKAARFLDYRVEDFERLLRVNLYGVIHLMQAVLPGMQARQFGRIINIASTAGKWGSMNQSAYNVTKHGVVGLTRCVALESGKTGVTVNAICPGMVQTDMGDDFWREHAVLNGTSEDVVRNGFMARVPIGRLLQPEEIGGLAAYLASPTAGGITGQSILADGGLLFV